MGTWLMIGAANIVVGALVGLCGVAGFLLPMFYTASLGMSVSEGLALSFAAFIVSGALGSWNYKKAGNLDVKFGLKLSAGSLAGAVLGVKLNMIIPEDKVKILLYLVVLLSGISILLRKDKKETEEKTEGASIGKNLPAVLLLGAVTGAICSMSGAGGPVLVMPLLVVLGIPAVAGYLSQCRIHKILPVLLLALITHGAGVYFGSKNAARINQKLLKKGIAVFSIIIAACKLGGVF